MSAYLSSIDIGFGLFDGWHISCSEYYYFLLMKYVFFQNFRRVPCSYRFTYSTIAPLFLSCLVYDIISVVVDRGMDYLGTKSNQPGLYHINRFIYLIYDYSLFQRSCTICILPKTPLSLSRCFPFLFLLFWFFFLLSFSDRCASIDINGHAF